MGEACKAAVEAYTASLLPPTAMCELVLNMRGPKSSWRTLSELCMLRKMEYHRTVPGGPYSRAICTEQDFQARWKELVGPVELVGLGLGSSRRRMALMDCRTFLHFARTLLSIHHSLPRTMAHHGQRQGHAIICNHPECQHKCRTHLGLQLCGTGVQ